MNIFDERYLKLKIRQDLEKQYENETNVEWQVGIKKQLFLNRLRANRSRSRSLPQSREYKLSVLRSIFRYERDIKQRGIIKDEFMRILKSVDERDKPGCLKNIGCCLEIDDVRRGVLE